MASRMSGGVKSRVQVSGYRVQLDAREAESVAICSLSPVTCPLVVASAKDAESDASADGLDSETPAISADEVAVLSF